MSKRPAREEVGDEGETEEKKTEKGKQKAGRMARGRRARREMDGFQEHGRA